MRASTSFVFPSLLLASLVAGHARLVDPRPMKAFSEVNGDHKTPLEPDGSQFPCWMKPGTTRETFKANLASEVAVATWTAGSQQTFSLGFEQDGRHMGGACQVSLSYDDGDNWWVVEEYQNCPPEATGTPLTFTLPAKIPANPKVLFGWTWFNLKGNREMYMNCAMVAITSSADEASSTPATIPFKTSPAGKRMFVANQAGINTCLVLETNPPTFAEMMVPAGTCTSTNPVAPEFVQTGSVPMENCQPRNVLSIGPYVAGATPAGNGTDKEKEKKEEQGDGGDEKVAKTLVPATSTVASATSVIPTATGAPKAARVRKCKKRVVRS